MSALVEVGTDAMVGTCGTAESFRLRRYRVAGRPVSNAATE
jgi:hypothetical protein